MLVGPVPEVSRSGAERLGGAFVGTSAGFVRKRGQPGEMLVVALDLRLYRDEQMRVASVIGGVAPDGHSVYWRDEEWLAFGSAAADQWFQELLARLPAEADPAIERFVGE